MNRRGNPGHDRCSPRPAPVRPLPGKAAAAESVKPFLRKTSHAELLDENWSVQLTEAAALSGLSVSALNVCVHLCSFMPSKAAKNQERQQWSRHLGRNPPQCISPDCFDRADEHLPKLRHVELERSKGVTAFRRSAAKITDRHAGRQRAFRFNIDRDRNHFHNRRINDVSHRARIMKQSRAMPCSFRQRSRAFGT